MRVEPASCTWRARLETGLAADVDIVVLISLWLALPLRRGAERGHARLQVAQRPLQPGAGVDGAGGQFDISAAGDAPQGALDGLIPGLQVGVEVGVMLLELANLPGQRRPGVDRAWSHRRRTHVVCLLIVGYSRVIARDILSAYQSRAPPLARHP